jgi:lysophospholipase L1-like esterase
MTSKDQKMIACLVRAAVAAVFIAAHLFALHTDAEAQVPTPALFVAPNFTPVAAPAGTPAAMSAVAGPGTRPPSSNLTKPVVLPPSATRLVTSPIACTAPAEFAHFDRPLVHTMQRLASGEPLTIVAIGSSSTAGAGASSADASYPSRLAAELKERFPGHDIRVINRGVNGEETNDMMARFETGVFAEHPQLILWQVGTNSVLRDRPLDLHSLQLHQGIDQLKATGSDVVLIDLQYAPAVIAKSETTAMVEQIALAAKEKNVDLFRRFAVMRNWYEVQHLSFDDFVAPDSLHMNDWSYACLAKLLGSAISEAATRPVASAAVHPAAAPAKAGVQ